MLPDIIAEVVRERFGIAHHLDFYPVDELTRVVARSASILGVDVTEEGAVEIARRARGTPRIANRLLRRARDYAQVRAQGRITVEVAREALEFEGVDPLGLTAQDRELLRTIVQVYNGGPVGIEALAATLNEEVDSLEEMVEPFLLKIGLLTRTPGGRRVTPQACDHLGVPTPDRSHRSQGALFA